MLIQKGNFPNSKSRMLRVALLFALLTNLLTSLMPGLLPTCHAQAAPRTPDAVAAEFYGWYLDRLEADQDPLSDRYPTFAGYVAKDLAARLLERLKSGHAPDSDYFLQAPEPGHAWQGRDGRRQVRARLLRRRGASAEVQLTLGRQLRSQRVLALGMVLENGAWKVRTVALANDDIFKSSPAPAGI